MTESLTINATCPTCNTPFQGKHCYKCGEKQVDVKDYTLKKYLEQAIDIFTHFDGKIFLSIKYLLFYPGRLTCEFLAGKRVKLMKPFQLYLIINIIYFLFLKNFDAYYIGLEYVAKQGDYLSTTAVNLAKQKAQKQNIPFDQPVAASPNGSHAATGPAAHSTQETFIDKFDHKAPDYGRAFLLLQLPLLALVCYLLYFYRQRLVVPHLVYTTHLFTGTLIISFLYIVIVGLPIMFLFKDFAHEHRKLIWTISTVVIAVYIALAAKRVYRENWLLTIAKTVMFVYAYGLVFNYYRMFITYATIWLM